MRDVLTGKTALQQLATEARRLAMSFPMAADEALT